MLFKKRWSDQDILAGIKIGNHEALRQLYSLCQPSIARHILNNNGTEEEADDMAQETVIIIWQKVHQPEFLLSSALTTFAVAIAKNLWLKQLQKKSRTSQLSEQHHDIAHVDGSIQRQRDAKTILSLMDELSDTCKELLGLFYFEELDMTEIASRLNLANANTAKAKKYQCFQKLAELVKRQFDKTDF